MFKEKIDTLPNYLSFTALFLAWIGILFLFKNYILLSYIFILLAFVFDTLDGFFARKYSLVSEFGKMLDSHVDVFIYLLYPVLVYYFYFGFQNLIFAIIYFIFLACGIFRLLRFNIIGLSVSSDDKKYYNGLPVFVNIFFLGIVLIIRHFFFDISEIFIYLLLLLSSFLMVMNFKFLKPF